MRLLWRVLIATLVLLVGAGGAALGATGWSGPMHLSDGLDGGLSMVLDTGNHSHVAIADDAGVRYLTDRSGSWTSKGLTDALPGGYDGSTSIARDASDGSLTIAFYRTGCGDCLHDEDEGIWYVTNRGGSWSAPKRIVAGLVFGPSLKVSGDRIALAYVRWHFGGSDEVRFTTVAGGSWTDVLVRRGARDPPLRLDERDRPAIAFTVGSSIGYAKGSRRTGGFSTETIAGSKGDNSLPSLVLDAAGRPHVSWTRLVASTATDKVLYARRTGTGWTVPRVLLTDDAAACSEQLCFRTDSSSIGLDDRDRVHIAATTGSGVTHFTNRSGAFTTRRLMSTQIADGAALRVGPDGRVRVAWLIVSGSRRGTWFSSSR